MNAEQILAVSRPQALFSGATDVATAEYRTLAKAWHPDRCSDPRASEVFAHVKDLYDEAIKRLAEGRWEGAGRVVLATERGTSMPVDYQASAAFELGRQYVSAARVVYVVEAPHRLLVTRASERLQRGFTYPSDRVAKDISRCLPLSCERHALAGDAHALMVPKTNDLLLLRDVLQFFGGHMDARHVAWVLSALYNLVCYLSHAGIVHHAISPDTVFVSPKYHSVALLGGWWYAVDAGQPVTVVPARTHAYLPWKVRISKRADPLTDLELILATGRELLGDLAGATLTPSAAPKAMLSWLSMASTGTAFAAYKAWDVVLAASFGPRKFVPLDITADQVYLGSR